MASVDQGLGILFIRAESLITPASPQPNAANGGAFSTNSGWYGWPHFGNQQSGGDYSPVSIWISNQLPETNLTNFLMQAYESGGGCVGNVRRVWIAVGTVPDLTGAQYTGARCSPPGTFVNYAVLAEWVP